MQELQSILLNAQSEYSYVHESGETNFLWLRDGVFYLYTYSVFVTAGHKNI